MHFGFKGIDFKNFFIKFASDMRSRPLSSIMIGINDPNSIQAHCYIISPINKQAVNFKVFLFQHQAGQTEWDLIKAEI